MVEEDMTVIKYRISPVVWYYSYISILYFQIISGAVMNILCLVVLQICVNTWTYAYLGLGVYPSWAPNSHANISTTAFPHAAGTLNVTLMPYSNWTCSSRRRKLHFLAYRQICDVPNIFGDQLAKTLHSSEWL